MKANGYLLTIIELKSLIFRLDKDGDGRVSFTEFQEIFGSLNEQDLRGSQRLNDEISKNSLFQSTNFNRSRFEESKIEKGEEKDLNSSMLRGSYNDLNLRASMRTYTSPSREKQNLNNSLNNSRTFSPQAKVSSPGRYTSPRKQSIYSPQRIQNLSSQNSYTYDRQAEISTRVNIVSPTINALKESLRDSYTFTSRQNRNYNTNLNSSRQNMNISSNLSNSFSNLSKVESNQEISIVLVKHFRELIDLETRLESAKEKFSLLPDVTINQLYRQFSNDKYGTVGLLDFKENIEAQDIFCNLEDVKLIFKRYNSSRTGRLRYVKNCYQIVSMSFLK
jgi:Ca2+-binding EF-hand superfamily protein